MKFYQFALGVVAGAAVSAVVMKKVCDYQNKKAKDDGLTKANATIDSLRSSVDSINKQLGERIQSEQTYVAQCEELKAKVASGEAKIEELEKLCQIQEKQIRKMENS